MDYTKLIQKWIQEDESITIVLMNIAAQLYRENGLQEITYKNINFKKGDVLFTDSQWDSLKKKLKFVEPKMNAANRPKVKQLYAFGTLEKFTETTLEKYKKRIEKINGIKELILLPKYDGIGLRIYYGEMFLTRYDQQYGLDISYKVKHLLPSLPKDCILRGELITLIEHEGYATKRHYVSAMIGNEAPLPKDIQFICYEYLQEGVSLTFVEMLRKINKLLNFKHKAIKIKKEDLSVSILNDFKKQIPEEYKTDGIVIRPNENDFVYEDKEKPSYQVAYKFDTDKFEGKIKEIQWSIKQQGFLQPTLILQDIIVIDGSNIQKATGNNFNYLYRQNLYPGSNCLVSLKIVPRIEGDGTENKKTEQQFAQLIKPKQCPNCGGEIEIIEDSVDKFKCKNFYQRKCFMSIIINRAKKFLQIKGIGEKGLEKLIQQKDFNFMNWVNQYKPTNKQLFLILSDDIDIKKIDQLYSENGLQQLMQLYKFI